MTDFRPQLAVFRCPNCQEEVHVECHQDERRDAIKCNCGQRSMVTIPARDFDPSAPLITPRTSFEPEGKLDTGMKASEAIKRAEHWWETKGAKEMTLNNLRQQETPGGSNRGLGSQFASLNPNDPNFLPSGILAGRPWDVLTKREKLAVTKIWHHYFVRKPDTLGENPQDPLKLTPHNNKDRMH